jgi:RelE toxin of RelE / RelB toxin-antitoxin system
VNTELTLKVFATKWFVRFARKEKIEDQRLREAVARAEAGNVDADLGGNLIKQRIGGKEGTFGRVSNRNRISRQCTEHLSIWIREKGSRRHRYYRSGKPEISGETFAHVERCGNRKRFGGERIDRGS